MDNTVTPGIAVVAVGVLIVVLSRALSLASPWPLVLSITGAIVAVVGAFMVYRAQQQSKAH